MEENSPLYYNFSDEKFIMSGGFGGVTVGISLIDGGPFAKYKG